MLSRANHKGLAGNDRLPIC